MFCLRKLKINYLEIKNDMKIIHKQDGRSFQNSETCNVSEYDLGNREISGAVADIKGRYPEKGYLMNMRCKELAYILKGGGKVNISGQEEIFAAGDMILIEAGEKYFWEGDLSVFLCSAPAWDLGQCQNID